MTGFKEFNPGVPQERLNNLTGGLQLLILDLDLNTEIFQEKTNHAFH